MQKKPWTRAEVIGILAIVCGLLHPEIRKKLGLDPILQGPVSTPSTPPPTTQPTRTVSQIGLITAPRASPNVHQAVVAGQNPALTPSPSREASDVSDSDDASQSDLTGKITEVDLTDGRDNVQTVYLESGVAHIQSSDIPRTELAVYVTTHNPEHEPLEIAVQFGSDGKQVTKPVPRQASDGHTTVIYVGIPTKIQSFASNFTVSLRDQEDPRTQLDTWATRSALAHGSTLGD